MKTSPLRHIFPRLVLSLAACLLFLPTYSFASDAVEKDDLNWKELETDAFVEGRQLKSLLKNTTEDSDLARTKLTIDKMIDPSIDVEANLKKIDELVLQIRAMLVDKSNPTDGEKMSAIRKYLYDAGPWNNYQTFRYDLDYPEGTNITEKLISNYIATRKGNCISMPILFTILGQRMGLDVTLSTAPLHVFVKYTDHATGMTINVETVNGGYPARDVWMRQNFPMTDEAIANGVYMKRLSKQEAVAVMSVTLAEFFTAKKQYKKAVVISETILQYYPAEAQLMVRIGSSFSKLIKREFASKYPTAEDIPADQLGYYQYLAGGNQFYFAKAEKLGWRQPTEEQNQAYLNGIKKAKALIH